MNKKTITIMLAYVGVVTGAGLASGQELLQYFVGLGLKGMVGISMVAILHMLIGGLLLQLGSHYLANDHSDVFDEITNKFISKFMDLSLIFTCFVIGFVMIAGAGSNLNQAFGTPSVIGSIICTVLIIGVGMLDFEKVSKVIGSFTPFIIVFTLIGSIYTFTHYKPDWQAIAEIAQNLPSNFDTVGVSVLNYFGMCLMTAVSMALVLGGDELNTGEAGLGGLLGGLLVGILGILIVLTLFIRVDEVKSLDIPMLYIIEDINPILGKVMAAVIFGMIFNTAISLFYALARRFSNGDEKKFKILLVTLTLVGFALSFGGFKKLVSVFYPIIGYAGIIMLIVLVFAYFKEKSSIKYENIRRFAINHYMRKKLDDDMDYTKEDKKKLKRLINRSHIDNEDMKEKSKETVEEILENEDNE
ncbi:hypothetical protein [uncultured Anaerococcus sp.]|uniref:YkvI family membrane protein n=1 Tax=uncultured Anaerococcus sp. TaxID=293428 RepID=UPI00280B1F09|nr:hypothetical protein [uncultured Anaerococcus sp.]MDU5149746.1 hypothetical protein [Anaerococcus prevotii]